MKLQNLEFIKLMDLMADEALLLNIEKLAYLTFEEKVMLKEIQSTLDACYKTERVSKNTFLNFRQCYELATKGGGYANYISVTNDSEDRMRIKN